jgi:hypothetical protein
MGGGCSTYDMANPKGRPRLGWDNNIEMDVK